MNLPDTQVLWVTYMEARLAPPPPAARTGLERIAREHLSLGEYLAIYRDVGEPLRWDQRSSMPAQELRALLDGESLCIYILRNAQDHALGLCEFDRSAFPEIELENFGLIPARRFLSTNEPDSPCTMCATSLLGCSSLRSQLQRPSLLGLKTERRRLGITQVDAQ